MAKSNKKTVFILQVDRKQSGKLEAFGYCDSRLPKEALLELLKIANELIGEELAKHAIDVEPEIISESTAQRD